MEKTLIAWTDATFNIAWGCMKVSPGCKNCYADTLSQRYQQSVTYWGPGSERRTFGASHWQQPIKWNAQAAKAGKRFRVFSSSMCDVFEDHPTITQERERLWSLIRQTPWLDWQLLTKRADRIADNLPADWDAGYPNVWLGVSIESKEYLWRMDMLKPIPAIVHFISFEPLLESVAPVDLSGIEWVIVGGESGQKYRPMDHVWAREIRDACRQSGTAFFFKQSAAYRTEMGTDLTEADGTKRMIREYPNGTSQRKEREHAPYRQNPRTNDTEAFAW